MAIQVSRCTADPFFVHNAIFGLEPPLLGNGGYTAD
jgi:hypothetical protein